MRKRAEQWDQPAAEYVELAERYLGFQQPGSKYNFQDAGDGHRRVRVFQFLIGSSYLSYDCEWVKNFLFQNKIN